jgi:MFS transporter, OFA family, oxalate/formate antiporter
MSKNTKSPPFYGNRIVVSCFLIQMICIGVIFSFGVFFKQFQTEFGWSRAAISGASSLNFLLTGLAGILAGRLNDRIGPRLIVTGAGIMLGVGYLLMSRLQEIWQLYLVYGVIIGIGISAVDIITLSTIARWYVRKRGVISGIVKVGTGSGQLVIPLVIAILIVSMGWRNSYLVMAVMTTFILVAVARVLRRDPEGMGLLPDGDPVNSLAGKTRSNDFSISMKTALQTHQFWIICLVLFSLFFCLISVIVHVVPHARDSGVSPTAAAAILSTSGGISMVGRMVMGISNDRIGGKNSLMVCFIILLTSLIILQLADRTWMFFLFAGVYGFAHGGIFTVISPTIAEYFGLVSHGVLLGITYFIGTIGGAIGPFIAGYIYDNTGSYQLAFNILTGMVLSGLLLITLLKPIRDV